ncbi:MAG: pheT, partial [Spartobacteria bacterium]|nr:pheT [Spartobacteria bacterium]
RIENVKVGPSPEWLRARIESVGIRSINNIVDNSNFVMLELGQPTHAFDADKLKGDIHVRLAREGEKFLALDGKTYPLTPRDLVITDQERVVGIGGVKGGEETGVTSTTQNILLEAAYFAPAGIRRTARDLSLPSDASYRFERGVDPAMILRASHRAAELMREIASGKPSETISIAGELPQNPADVSLHYERCNQLLGVIVAPRAVDQILKRFGLNERETRDDHATWQIPSYRRDLVRDVDLIEEVVRAFGVHKISGTNRSRFTSLSPADHAHDRETELRLTLAGRGLCEVRTSKLIPRHDVLVAGNAVELRNPLSEDHVALRPDLITGLLGALERNIRGGAERVAIFELGRIFLPPDATEQRRLGILVYGKAATGTHWRADQKSKRRLDFVDLKGAIESVSETPLAFRRGQHRDLALAAEILAGNNLAGFAGQIAITRAAKLDATAAIFVAELNLDLLLGPGLTARTFQEMDRYPAVRRDIAMIVPETLTHSEILGAIRAAGESLLQSVELFDLFGGEETSQIGAGKKSLAYTLTYRDKNRTLTSEEVTAAHARIRERLQSELGAEVRE